MAAVTGGASALTKALKMFFSKKTLKDLTGVVKGAGELVSGGALQDFLSDFKAFGLSVGEFLTPFQLITSQIDAATIQNIMETVQMMIEGIQSDSFQQGLEGITIAFNWIMDNGQDLSRWIQEKTGIRLADVLFPINTFIALIGAVRDAFEDTNEEVAQLHDSLVNLEDINTYGGTQQLDFELDLGMLD
jgi:phenylalanine-4-hydroxylase